MKKVIKLHRTPERKNVYHNGLGILWPCDMYAINVKAPSTDRFNLFERTVISLCKVKPHTKKQLSQLLGIDIELINFITARLCEEDVLNQEEDILHFHQIKNEQTITRDSHVIYVFKDCMQDSVVPYTYQPERSVEYRKVKITGHNSLAKVYFTSNKKGNSIKSIPLQPVHSRTVPPTLKDVLEVIQKHKQIHEHFPSSLENYDFKQEGGLTINPKPERVHLFCDVYIDPVTEDHTVTDGFGYKTSPSFSSFIQRMEPKDCTRFIEGTEQDWRDYLRKEWNVQQQKIEKPRDLKNFTSQVTNYQTLPQQLLKVQDALTQLPPQRPLLSQEVAKCDRNLQEYYRELWGAIEEVFRLAYRKLSEDDKIAYSQKYIGDIAQKKMQALDIATEANLIGVELKKEHPYRNINELSLFRFDGPYSVPKSLTMFLAQSTIETDCFIRHLPIHSLTVLAFLFRARNNVQHSTSIDQFRIYGQDLYRTYQYGCAFIFAVFPELRPSDINMHDLQSFDTDFYQEEARTQATFGLQAVEKIFGFKLTYHLKEHHHHTYRYLVDLENLRIETDQNPTITTKLYALLESALKYQQITYQNSGITVQAKDLHYLLGEITNQYPKTSLPNLIDKNLRSNLTRVLIQNKGHSLNIQYLAILILSYIANPSKQLLTVDDANMIRTICRKRGHGHHPQPLPNASEILNNTYTIIKNIYSTP